MECVAHAVALSAKIALVVLIGHHFYRHVLHYLKPVSLQADTLCGIVGQQAHLVYAKVAQHLRSAAIVTLVGCESEVHVCVYGVVAFFLQLVSLGLPAACR